MNKQRDNLLKLCGEGKCKKNTDYLISLLENTECDILDYLSRPTTDNYYIEHGEFYIKQQVGIVLLHIIMGK